MKLLQKAKETTKTVLSRGENGAFAPQNHPNGRLFTVVSRPDNGRGPIGYRPWFGRTTVVNNPQKRRSYKTNRLPSHKGKAACV